MSHDLEADFTGWLWKKGEKVKAYRKRWFVLRDCKLYYFKQKRTKRAAGHIVIGPNVRVVQDQSKENSLLIGGPLLPRTFEIRANTPRELDEWLVVLKAAIAQATRAQTVRSSIRLASAADVMSPGAAAELAAASAISPDLFEILTMVARGSLGDVFKVRKRDTGEIFAMKVFCKDQLIGANALEHVVAEKCLMARIKHPFVVPLHFAFQSPDRLFLVLEYMNGGSLAFHLEQEGHFRMEKVRFYAAEILSALNYIHERNIVYGNLNAETVVLDFQGHVKLADFRLATTPMPFAKPGVEYIGSPEYLAPEVIQGLGACKSSDWWSFGILIFEMITGSPPFVDNDISVLCRKVISAPIRFQSSIPEEVVHLLKHFFVRDSLDRLGSQPGDADKIRQHPFFREMAWEKLEGRQLFPPFRPNLKSNEFGYFEEFVEPTSDSVGQALDDLRLEDFAFVRKKRSQ